MTYRLAIDVGGTFTDFLLLDSEGDFQVFKVPTIPSDPSEAVFNGLNMMREAKKITFINDFLKEIEVIVHGATITTNAVLTGNGSKAGFITTRGFRDVLNMRRGLREDQYETKQEPPRPLIPRHLIQPVEERINCVGDELVPVNREDLNKALGVFMDEEVEAIGVSFMFSFFNPLHERQVVEIIEEVFPEVYITPSSDVLPQIRLYERNSTVALNAYVGPILKRYLKNLLKRLKDNDFLGTFLVMQSNGGVMSPDVAIKFAGNTLLSGPAGGPTAGIYYGSVHGLNNIITVDMGGTSFDACLVRDGKPSITTEASIAQHRVAFPVININTIGAGGGSVAWIDSGGILKVGPQSAGAVPGPACYGKGGTRPTVTDADLVLGYLNANYFYDGKIKLDQNSASRVIEKEIAKPLGITVDEAAYGIYQLINAKMAAELRLLSVARGYDPREFALIVAGGAGPVHAGMIAKELEIPLIIVPKGSSVFCAMGMLLSDLRHDYVRTYTMGFDSVDLSVANSLIKQMEEEAKHTLKQEGISKRNMVIECSADVRYEGQFNEVEVLINKNHDHNKVTREDLYQTLQMFHEKHDRLYGYSMPGSPAKIINLRIHARGITEKPTFKLSNIKSEEPSSALKTSRKASFGNGFVLVPVYDGLKLGYGNQISGPAIIEEPTTTILLPPGFNMVCDHHDNYLIHSQKKRVGDLIAALRGDN